MAVVGTNLTSGIGSDGTSVVTASIAPGANRLVLAFIHQSRIGGGTPTTPTISGGGLTWVQVITRQTSADTAHRITLWRGLSASPGSGTVTFSFSENSAELSYHIDEFDAVDTSGTNGSGAVVQSVGNDQGSGATLTMTLAAFGSTDNATYGVCKDSGTSVGGGFTSLSNTANSRSEWRADNDTTVDFGTSGFAAGFGVEIKAAPAAAKGLTIRGVG